MALGVKGVGLFIAVPLHPEENCLAVKTWKAVNRKSVVYCNQSAGQLENFVHTV